MLLSGYKPIKDGLYSAKVLIGPNPTPTSISRTPNQVCLWNPKARDQLLLCIADRCKGHFSLSSSFAFKILLVRHKINTTQVQRLREESRGRVVLLLVVVVEEVFFCISVVVGVDKDN